MRSSEVPARAEVCERNKAVCYVPWPARAPIWQTGEAQLVEPPSVGFADACRVAVRVAAACVPYIVVVSNAIRSTIVAKALVMNVSTLGSLFDRLSHHRKGLSTQPPSVL